MLITKTILISILSFLSTFLPQKTYIEGVVGQSVNINPLEVSSNEVDCDLESLIFNGLTKYNKNGELVSDLAERWEISEDGKQYTFFLRKDVFFHDGQKLTADDVIYTASQSRELKNLAIDRMDEYTVRFNLKDPFAPFLSVMTLGIVPQHLGDKMNPLKPIGTGPYKITKVVKDGLIKEIWLQAVFKDQPVSRLVFRFYPNKEDVFTAAKLGEIDGYGDQYAKSWEGFKTYENPLSGRYYGLFFNFDVEKIRDQNLRKELARTVPKETIASDVFGGKAKPIDSPIENSWATNSDLERPIYNPHPEESYDLELELTVPDSKEHLKTAALIRENWEKLGVRLNFKKVPLVDIPEQVIKPRNFEVLLLGQEVGVDPDRYSLWHSTQTNYPGLNFTGYEAVRADKSLEEGRKEFDREERKKHYHIFQNVFMNDVPAIFLYQPTYTYAIKYKFSDEFNKTGLSNIYVPSDRLRWLTSPSS